jgi:hypothetical protein
MTNVNWVKDAEYRETQSKVLNEFFTTIWNSYGEVFIHDTEITDDQPDEYLRVLDDSPDVRWVEWEHDVNDEFHVIARKTQKDGGVLIKVDESYDDSTFALPPLYLLVKGLQGERVPLLPMQLT